MDSYGETPLYNSHNDKFYDQFNILNEDEMEGFFYDTRNTENEIENFDKLYKVNVSDEVQEPTEKNESFLNKKATRTKKSIEEIRAKNRERTKKSREKRIQDIMNLVVQVNSLKKENLELKAKINSLCPQCQKIMKNFSDKSCEDKGTNSIDSETQSKVSLQTSTQSTNSTMKRIAPLFFVISAFCILFLFAEAYPNNPIQTERKTSQYNFIIQNNMNYIRSRKVPTQNSKRRLLFEKGKMNYTELFGHIFEEQENIQKKFKFSIEELRIICEVFHDNKDFVGHLIKKEEL